MPVERVVRAGFENKVPRTADEFAKAWRESTFYEELMQEITDFDKQHPVDGPALSHFQESRKAEKSSLM
jgi:ATP-binding cassette subfamily G (WHITE) protein 2 (PDR)